MVGALEGENLKMHVAGSGLPLHYTSEESGAPLASRYMIVFTSFSRGTNVSAD